LVTLELPADSPVLDLPWVVTFGPLGDEREWEPVVCGPYLRPHALALAQAVVADEELMAVVEPVMPLPSVAEIRAEIGNAQLGPEEGEYDFEDEEPVVGVPLEPTEPPSRDEVRAGFARVAALLAGVR
jgi:hypothetical protein